MNLTSVGRRSPLSTTPNNDKETSLRRYHALNPRPEGVSDPAFGRGIRSSTPGTWSR